MFSYAVFLNMGNDEYVHLCREELTLDQIKSYVRDVLHESNIANMEWAAKNKRMVMGQTPYPTSHSPTLVLAKFESESIVPDRAPICTANTVVFECNTLQSLQQKVLDMI